MILDIVTPAAFWLSIMVCSDARHKEVRITAHNVGQRKNRRGFWAAPSGVS